MWGIMSPPLPGTKSAPRDSLWTEFPIFSSTRIVSAGPTSGSPDSPGGSNAAATVPQPPRHQKDRHASSDRNEFPIFSSTRIVSAGPTSGSPDSPGGSNAAATVPQPPRHQKDRHAS